MRFISLFTLICLFSATLSAQWTKKSSIPGNERHHPVTFSIDGKGYYLTGMDAANNLLKDFYEYNPTTDTWTKKADFPGIERGFAYGAALDGKGYVGMGVSNTNYLGDLWEYDPINDKWTELATLSNPRRHPAFIPFEGKIYVGLGDGPGGNLNDWWYYTVASDTWTKGPNLPAIQRHHPYYFQTNDYVYAGFGHSSAGIEKDFWRYNTDDNTWTRMNDFPGEARVAGAQFSYNGTGYILGGDGSDHSNLDTGEFFEYDEVNDAWNELPPAPGQGRWAAGTFVIGDKVYYTSGETGNNVLYNDLWVYDLTLFASTNELVQNTGSFDVYPNPASSQINIPNEVMDHGIARIQLLDASGKMYVNAPINQASIEVDQLPTQLYIVLIQTERGGIFQSRFLKN